MSNKFNREIDIWKISSDYCIVDPDVAAKLGSVDEAIVLRTLYNLCRFKRQNYGTSWYQGSKTYWLTKFSWLSESKLKRVFSNLKERGLLEIDIAPRTGNSYRVNEENLQKLLSETSESVQNDPNEKIDSVQNEPVNRVKMNRQSGQNEPVPLYRSLMHPVSDPDVAAADATALTVSQFENSRPDPNLKTKSPQNTAETWTAYSEWYEKRYKVQPARNAKVNSQLKQFCERVGFEDAPKIITFYLLQNDYWYVKQMHTIGVALAEAEKLVAGYRRGTLTTRREAEYVDKTSSKTSFISQILDLMESEDAQKGGTHEH